MECGWELTDARHRLAVTSPLPVSMEEESVREVIKGFATSLPQPFQTQTTHVSHKVAPSIMADCPQICVQSQVACALSRHYEPD